MCALFCAWVGGQTASSRLPFDLCSVAYTPRSAPRRARQAYEGSSLRRLDYPLGDVDPVDVRRTGGDAILLVLAGNGTGAPAELLESDGGEHVARKVIGDELYSRLRHRTLELVLLDVLQIAKLQRRGDRGYPPLLLPWSRVPPTQAGRRRADREAQRRHCGPQRG